MSKNHRITVGQELYKKLESYCENNNLNFKIEKEKAILQLLENQAMSENQVVQGELTYSLLGLKTELNKDLEVKNCEVDIVDKVVKNTGLSLQQIVKEALIDYCKKQNALSVRVANFDKMKDDQLKSSTIKGISNYRIDKMVQDLMDYNNNQSEDSHRFAITRALIGKLTGANKQNIIKYFESKKLMIDDHNNKFNFTRISNRGKDINLLKSLIEND